MQQEIIRSRDGDVTLGALPTKASILTELTASRFLKNQPEIKNNNKKTTTKNKNKTSSE